MQPQSPQSSSAPHIRSGNLANHVGKPVHICGKVSVINGMSIQLDCGDGTRVNVKRNVDDIIPVQVGTHVMVRGIVQGDKSVLSIANFPLTDLGLNFDLGLHNDTVDLMTQTQLSHLFAGS